MCQEGGVKKGGTWRMLRVPDRTHGGHGCSWRPEWCFFTPMNIPWKFCVDSSIRSVSGRGGVKKGGTWRTLRVPDQRHGGHSHSWRHEWCFFTPRKIPWKFCVDISIISVSRMGGGQEGGYLEDVEGSSPETWRTWLFLTSWMMFFDPKEDTLKISCRYLN